MLSSWTAWLCTIKPVCIKSRRSAQKVPVLVEHEAYMPKISRTDKIIQIECATAAETIKVYAHLVAQWVETSSTLALNSLAQEASLQHLDNVVKAEEQHRSVLKHTEECFPDYKEQGPVNSKKCLRFGYRTVFSKYHEVPLLAVVNEPVKSRFVVRAASNESK
jgi:hypothetical protein